MNNNTSPFPHIIRPVFEHELDKDYITFSDKAIEFIIKHILTHPPEEEWLSIKRIKGKYPHIIMNEFEEERELTDEQLEAWTNFFNRLAHRLEKEQNKG